MDRAVHHVQVRDTQKCCEYAHRAILADRKMLKLAKATLRMLVLDRLQCAGHVFFKSLFKRHAPFLALPKPVRGKALGVKASELSLVTRTENVFVLQQSERNLRWRRLGNI